jgi:filamentous hemagglutinin family protein
MWLLSMLLGALPFLWVTSSHGQTSITSSGLNTTVTQAGQNYNITGGTRPANGPNLFHSFGDFSVGANNVARFLNDSGLATTNILSRVTGGNVSNIFGEINTLNFPGANLYLINPAGVVFGASATLNVAGAVNISTADYLRLTDGVRFNAVPGPQDALLSTAPVAAFGFLNSAPKPITVQSGGSLTVRDALSLVGGDINISGNVVAQEGIALVSVASPGEVRTNFGIGGSPTIDLSGFDTLGNISVNRAEVLVPQIPAPIEIHGGRLVVSGGGTIASPGPVTVNVSDSVRVFGGPFDDGIISGSRLAIKAGQSILTGEDAELIGTSVELTAPRISHQGDLVSRGAVTIQADQLSVEKLGPGTISGVIQANGPIVINANTAELTGARIRTDVAAGQAGNISIRAGEVTVGPGGLPTTRSTISASSGSGNAGNIVIDSGTTLVLNSTDVTATSNNGNGGNIILQAGGQITMAGTRISTNSQTGSGGSVIVQANQFQMQDGSQILATSQVAGGTVVINATDTVRIDQSTINVSRPGAPLSSGDAGNISITAGKSVRLNGAELSAVAFPGNGGNIVIDAGRRYVSEGSTLNASSIESGNGGNIIIQAGERVRINNGSIAAQAEEFGHGGNIFIRAPERIRINGGVVSTKGEFASAGNITYESDIVRLQNNTTESTSVFGAGGTITIRANDFRNVNSTVDVRSEFGPDGSVTILPFP